MKAIQATILLTFAVTQLVALPAFAGGFSASKGKADMARAENGGSSENRNFMTGQLVPHRKLVRTR